MKQILFVDIDKFTLCAFNRLLYDQEISSSLTVSSLLGLPKYYTPQRSLRKININNFCHKIILLLFPEGANIDFSDQFIHLD